MDNTKEKNLVEVLVCEPNKEPYKKSVTDELKSFQEIVGGFIESIFVINSSENPDREIVLYGNEEGKIRSLEPNYLISLDDSIHNIYDLLCGTLFFTCYEGEEIMSLSSSDISDCLSFIQKRLYPSFEYKLLSIEGKLCVYKEGDYTLIPLPRCY